MNEIINQDCLIGLKEIKDKSVDCCVTSPPYFGLRDYGTSEQIGLEDHPDIYINKLVDVFNEVKRVLKDEGTLWLNIGDSYAGSGKGRNSDGTVHVSASIAKQGTSKGTIMGDVKSNIIPVGCKPKDLIGIPWMLAFALRNSGWYLRQDIIWSKPNPMPESVKDRCTKSHEYIFLFSKSKNYYYDQESIMEDAVWDVDGQGIIKRKERQKDWYKNNPDKMKNGIRKTYSNKHEHSAKKVDGKRNKRSVWEVTTKPFSEAHFATFPQDLIVDCIKAGSPSDGIVLDPFMGSGTTAIVARKLNRNFIGFELNKEYIEIAEKRLYNEIGMFL